MGIREVMANAGRSIANLHGNPISYSRGDETFPLVATRGNTEFDKTTSDGVVTTIQSDDFLVPTADFAATGLGTPQRGDLISEELDGVTWIYELLPTEGERAWRYWDRHRQRLRIHTKKKGTA